MPNTPKNIVCDIDGVLVDIVAQWIGYYEKETDEKVPLDSYDLGKRVAQPELLYELLHEAADELYTNKPARTWLFAELLQCQERCDTNITFCTYAPPCGAFHREAVLKMYWLQKWVPKELRWSYAASAEKGKLGFAGDLIIEDNAEAAQWWSEVHKKPFVIVAQPWNVGVEPRVEERWKFRRLLKEYVG